MSSLAAARLPRDLHPVAWWLWSIGLAVAASETTNPWLLLLVIGVAALVVVARRGDQPWARSFRLYLGMAAVIVVIRVLFRILLGSMSGTVLVDLPAVPLPHWALGITLLGPVTREALVSGLDDGLRLAAIVVCVGAANALANPKRLLRSIPPALYEIGTALVVAITVLPQLADSLRRVRAAQQLRAGETRRVGRLRRLLVPVLEDALERSLALAASMDVRGYGRASTATPGVRRITSIMMLAAVAGLCVGCYGLLDDSSPAWMAVPMVVVGVALALVGLVFSGRRVGRTIYRPDRWRWPELVVVASGVVVGAVGVWIAHHDVLVAYPPVWETPRVTLLALVGILVGLMPALAAPAPKVAIA